MRSLAFIAGTLLALAGALLAGRSSDTFLVAMGITGVWFAALLAGGFIVARRRRELLAPLAAALVVTGALLTAFVGVPTLVGRSVDEVLATGNRLVAGEFVSLAHESGGRAAVVARGDGSRVLTLAGFRTDPGPDLRVYLSTGDPADGSLGEFADLGKLKGNRGDQQYAIPATVDLDRYRAAVVWCRAFSVAFTSAALK